MTPAAKKQAQPVTAPVDDLILDSDIRDTVPCPPPVVTLPCPPPGLGTDSLFEDDEDSYA